MKEEIRANGLMVPFFMLWIEDPTLEHLSPGSERFFDYGAVFDDWKSVEVDGLVYLVERTPRARLRFVNIGGHTFLEQNPENGSRQVKFAKETYQILWMLSVPRYFVDIKDGVFHDFRKSWFEI